MTRVQRNPFRPGRLHPLDLWFHRLPPLLLRQAGHRNDLVLYGRPAANRLDHRPVPDSRYGSSGRLSLSSRSPDYTFAWIPLTFRGSSASTASIWASGSPASSICSPAGCGPRVALRPVDAQRAGERDESLGVDAREMTAMSRLSTGLLSTASGWESEVNDRCENARSALDSTMTLHGSAGLVVRFLKPSLKAACRRE